MNAAVSVAAVVAAVAVKMSEYESVVQASRGTVA